MARVQAEREGQILAFARPHLDQGEDVEQWVRARHTDTGSEGFAYVTSRRLVVHWCDGKGRGESVAWGDIDSWGLDRGAPGGPVLGVETAHERWFVHLPAGSQSVANRVRAFLGRFVRLAPTPRRPLGGEGGNFETVQTQVPLTVSEKRKTMWDRTRKMLVTVLGIALLVGGGALLVLPGPGLLVVIAGFAVLATEYDWAKDALLWVRERYRKTTEGISRKKGSS